jgi:regulatory protein
MARARPEPSLKARALALLAQREHSPRELERKLLEAVRRSQLRRPAAGATDGHGQADAQEAQTGDVGDALTQARSQLPSLLADLQAAGHLSAERFIQSRIHTRAARQSGRRIAQELAHHGLVLDETSSQSLTSTESERALQLFLRRFQQAGGVAPDEAGRARQMRFLAGRGFSGETIRSVFKALKSPELGSD